MTLVSGIHRGRFKQTRIHAKLFSFMPLIKCQQENEMIDIWRVLTLLHAWFDFGSMGLNAPVGRMFDPSCDWINFGLSRDESPSDSIHTCEEFAVGRSYHGVFIAQSTIAWLQWMNRQLLWHHVAIVVYIFRVLVGNPCGQYNKLEASSHAGFRCPT